MKQKIKITREQIEQALEGKQVCYLNKRERNFYEASFIQQDEFKAFPDSIEVEVDVPERSVEQIISEMSRDGIPNTSAINEFWNKVYSDTPTTPEETAKRLATESFERCRPHLDKAFAPIKNIGDRITALERRVEKLELRIACNEILQNGSDQNIKISWDKS